MNRRGFIDEVNPGFIALALLGAGVAFFMTGRVQIGAFWKVLTPIVTFAVIYGYLAMTDN